MNKKMIIDAYCRIRTIDNTIPDDVLDFMKDSALERLKLNESNQMTSKTIYMVTTNEGWNEPFFDKDKAQNKIDNQYKRDFPNENFWIEEINIS